MIRQRGGATRRRDDQDEGPNSSAEEIGRLLREAREERGLDLLSVHDRLSRPITQLEALERGDLAGLPDQALALSTLRRYAAFIGLDGDALALRMIDAWSTAPCRPHQRCAPERRRCPVTNVVAAVTTGPDHLRAFTQTGQVPTGRRRLHGRRRWLRLRRGHRSPHRHLPGRPPPGAPPEQAGRGPGPAETAGPDVPEDHHLAGRPAGRWLWSPGLVILQQRPRWLVSAHILRVVGARSVAQPSAPATTPTAPRQAVAVVTPARSTGQSSNYSVNTSAIRRRHHHHRSRAGCR